MITFSSLLAYAELFLNLALLFLSYELEVYDYIRLLGLDRMIRVPDERTFAGSNHGGVGLDINGRRSGSSWQCLSRWTENKLPYTRFLHS